MNGEGEELRRRPQGTVYVGFEEIAGQYGAIVEALQHQSVPCHLHLRLEHPFAYPSQSLHRGWVLKIHRWITSHREHHDLPYFPNRVVLEAVRRVLWFVHAIAAIVRYRTFVFAFGMTFAPGARDLPLLRILRKRVVVVVSNGSEARPPYVDDAYRDYPSDKLADVVVRKVRSLRRIEKWADAVIGAPLSSSPFLSKPFVNYFAMGMPCREIKALADTQQVGNTDGQSVRILHAPSNPRGKGTNLIRLAIQSLTETGLSIEYVELTNQPNHVVLEQLAHCDFVVDQLYGDTPMATLASEAARLGKPTVVGGYGWDELRRWVPVDMWPPSETCLPEEVPEAILRLATEASYRLALGRKALDFVRTRWSLSEVGERWLMVLDGAIPNEWWVDPLSVIYERGAAISEVDARTRVQALIESNGVASLGLAHNPELEAAFVEFAKSPLVSEGEG